MPDNRQFIACTFRPGDRRSYTYHNDGEPVVAGDRVQIESRDGMGLQTIHVIEVDVPEPTAFPTKPIIGLAPPEEPADEAAAA